jgi:hypothetical protein
MLVTLGAGAAVKRATKASDPPPDVVWYAPAVTGKFVDEVVPVT